MVEDVFGIVGTTLAGTFHVEEVIAEGGFGVVYRAEHVAFRAPVALKCLKIPGTVTEDQVSTFVENFREEAEILFHLSAQIPEVVRPLHADAMTFDDGTFVPYIAMEWIDGRPLDSIVIMRQDDGLKPLSLRKVIKLLTPIAHALHKAHRFKVPGGTFVSVTHCDLKPENIVITESDNPVRAKILDYGIAKAREAVRQNVGRITASEVPKPFTPSYGAPEQWVPKRYGQSGPWTDVWGMALTLVECLTGDPPIEGDMHAMMGTALDPDRRPSPRTEGATVTDEVEAVFQKALAVDPRARHKTVEAFWTDLERAHGVPSSFERARVRRERPTFDEVTTDSQAPGEVGEEMADLGSGECGDLLLEESLLPLDSPRPGSEASEFEFEADSLVEEFAFDDELKANELDSIPPVADPGCFDLDIDTSDAPPARGSRPLAAATSGTWPNAAQRSTDARREARSTPPKALSTPPIPLPPPKQTLSGQLRVPIVLVGLGLVGTIVDMTLAKSIGGTLWLGPVRLSWIAIAVFALGMVMAFWSLAGDKDSD